MYPRGDRALPVAGSRKSHFPPATRWLEIVCPLRAVAIPNRFGNQGLAGYLIGVAPAKKGCKKWGGEGDHPHASYYMYGPNDGFDENFFIFFQFSANHP